MKKNYRLIGTLTMAALLAGNLSGCGAARNYQTETDLPVTFQDDRGSDSTQLTHRLQLKEQNGVFVGGGWELESRNS